MSSIPYPDEKFLFIHEIGTVQTSNSSMMDYKFNPVLGGSSLQGGPPVSVFGNDFCMTWKIFQ